MRRTPFIFPLLLVIYELAAYLSNDMYLPALPQMVSDLGISGQSGPLTVSAWFFGCFSLQWLLGPMADYFGRRTIFLWSSFIFVFSTAACAISTHFELLLFFRFLQGVTVSGILIAGYATLHELLEQKQAIITLSWMGGVTALAPALGPFFGCLVISFASWRWIFLILAILVSFALIALFRVMPETLEKDKRLPISFANLSRTYKSILKTKAYTLNALSASAIFVGMIAWISSGPFLTMEYFHLNFWHFAVIQGILCLGYILGTHMVKPILKSHSIDFLLNCGKGILLFSLFVLGVAVFYFPSSWVLWASALTIFEFAAGLCFSSLNRRAIEGVPEASMGARVALYSSFITGAGALGSYLMSLSAEPFLGLFYVITFSAWIALVLQSVLSQSQVLRFPRETQYD